MFAGVLFFSILFCKTSAINIGSLKAIYLLTYLLTYKLSGRAHDDK